MELVFVLAKVFFQVLFINFFKVMKIVRAFRIDTFVDDKVFSILLAGQRVITMGTAQGGELREAVFLRRKVGIANFAFDLSFLAIIAVKVRLGRIAERTGAVIGDVAFFTSGNRFDLHVIPVFEVRDEESPVPFMMMDFDLGEFIRFELLVLRRMRIIKSPLFEGDISADKLN
jgi:hypothetical protein